MHEASLAFFQNFYTNVSLYVVAEADENAPQLPAAAPAAPAAPVASVPLLLLSHQHLRHRHRLCQFHP
ncbi:hypothetical protein H9L05_16590 [Hymenobacter qilianensis]|uniref:Uncharacterized protein n=1 Tax=Hymenobacter qilianensis TaxID=1385715 RepID=A0A7H0GTH5_9BACT|nr:hypothetical protein [Hymenobacter qilianensis]QNP51591.1 hypothetical protein H9L05_16590 [Hymenobacter qilianensis]